MMPTTRTPVKHLSDCDHCFTIKGTYGMQRDRKVCLDCTAYADCAAAENDRAMGYAAKMVNRHFGR